MRCGVVSIPREAKSKWVGVSLVNGFVQLLLQICQQCRLRGGKPARIPSQSDCAIELVVRQPRNIVKVQRVCGIVRPIDIRICPLCRLLQVIGSSRVWQPCGQRPCTLQGKVEFHGPQFQVVAPLAFWIETEWNSREQVATGCGLVKAE